MLYEITQEYLDEVTRAVRVNQTPGSNEELLDLIQAALNDLGRQGAVLIHPNDPLIKRAVKLYCKAHYGYDVKPEFQAAYESLSAGIALDYDYKAGDAE